jgi:hypothetical protein
MQLLLQAGVCAKTVAPLQLMLLTVLLGMVRPSDEE